MATAAEDVRTVTILLLGNPGVGKSTFLSYVHYAFWMNII